MTGNRSPGRGPGWKRILATVLLAIPLLPLSLVLLVEGVLYLAGGVDRIGGVIGAVLCAAAACPVALLIGIASSWKPRALLPLAVVVALMAAIILFFLIRYHDPHPCNMC